MPSVRPSSQHSKSLRRLWLLRANTGRQAVYTVLRKYVSLHAVVAFALFMIPAVFFAYLAREIVDNETIIPDRHILQMVHGLSTPWLDHTVSFVTNLGGTIAVPCFTIFLFLVCWRRGYLNHGLLILLGVGGASFMSLILKLAFSRTRPDLWTHLVAEKTYSFPSGHAVGSAALAASIIIALWYTKWRRVAIIAGTVYVLAIGFTRLYAGVHYPTDILGGWLLAIGWVNIVRLLFNTSPRAIRPTSIRPELASGEHSPEAH